MACGEGALPHVPLKETTECRSHLSLRSFEWTLRRYARFETSKAAPPDSDTPGSSANAATWKVFEANEETGSLTLNIVASGHFFISQGPTLLEGFSLIDSQKWLKIGKRTDCLLFSAKVKNESRMFRLQFSGMSKEQSLEHCSHCVQVLQAYIAVQEQEYGVVAQEGKLATNDSSHHAPSHSEVHTSVLSKSSASGGRMSVMQLAQSVLKGNLTEQPLAYQQSAWNTTDLRPFLRLCLLDQHFPAFVEAVEKELQKLADA
ncbi:meiotic recombination protein REC114 isoform X2 [Lissotriton helveticus]